MSNNRIFLGAVMAVSLHGGALFLPSPSTEPAYDVVVARSSLQISLVKVPAKKAPVKPKAPPLPPKKKKPALQVKKEEVPLPQKMEETPENNVKQGAVAEVQPLTRHNRPPHYPRRARQLGWEGRVDLNVLVSRDGRAKDVDVLHSSGHGVLDQEAVRAIRQWLFEPAKLFGQPVEKYVKVPVVFRLENS